MSTSPVTSDRTRPVPAVLFGLTIVLSAFLLFQVQPLIAKLILPWFGGSAAVWTSCMLFFQLALLAGYGWAHWLNGQPLRRQILLHVGMLIVSLAVLPIVPSVRWKPVGGADPLLGILGLLTVTVGLPYFLLSATSPLIQSWYSRAAGGAMPYRFFALSNAGSMAGLLTYPVLVEPYITTHSQAWMWSGTFIAFVACFALVAFRVRSAPVGASTDENVSVESASVPAPKWSERLVWMALAACASAMLLAVTNHLTQNVAAIPFLWVLPLSLYLLSFILCFDSDRWYKRWLFAGLAGMSLPLMSYQLSGGGNFTALKVAVGLFSFYLFSVFMVCHGELAKRRPAPKYLTSFYLMVSVGGAAGGLLVGFVFPYVLPVLIDLPIVIVLTAFLLTWLLWRERSTDEGSTLRDERFLNEPVDKIAISLLSFGLVVFVGARFVAMKRFNAPAILQGPYDAAALLAFAGAFVLYLLWRVREVVEPEDNKRDRIVIAVILGGAAIFAAVRVALSKFNGADNLLDGYWDQPVLLGLAGLAALYLLWRSRDRLDDYNLLVCVGAVVISFGMAGYLARDAWDFIRNARLLKRNFYGALVVYDEDSGDKGPYRVLRHGTINHGEQYLWPQHVRHPTTYYAEKSGLGLALRSLRQEGNINVGSIGLGAGTTAIYARPGDHYFLYDINPIVPVIAKTQFTFLSHSYAETKDVILGDARLSLEDELKRGVNRKFDLLSVDAFSGDAIPVHLLTKEAFDIYWQHLRPNGVLAVHVSNLYLSLAPVVALDAKMRGKQALNVNFDGDDAWEETSSEWVLVTSRSGFFERDEIRDVVKPIAPIPGLREWTDDYSNLYRILR